MGSVCAGMAGGGFQGGGRGVQGEQGGHEGDGMVPGAYWSGGGVQRGSGLGEGALSISCRVEVRRMN